MSRQAKFRDGEGWAWEVVERSDNLDGMPNAVGDGGRALYFLSRYQTRRVDDFPVDWQLRPADELIDLWRAAVPL